MEFKIEDDVCSLWGEVVPCGEDCTIVVLGGAAHVGCTVLAIPRPSLTGTGMSATVSCLNRTGHLDDTFAGNVAKRVAAARSCVVACSCGIHLDDATLADLEHIEGLAPRVADAALELLTEHDQARG